MKYLWISLSLLSSGVYASDFRICTGEYALCAASPSTATNRMITVNTKDGPVQYPERVAVCPVLKGKAIADVSGGNMQGSCAPPGEGKVWSLFSLRTTFPQAPTWEQTPAAFQKYVTTAENGVSNQFSFACVLIKPVNGVKLANCYGAENETLNGSPVAIGTEIMTEAPVGTLYPVGGPLP
jgi:hypothetical protein